MKDPKFLRTILPISLELDNILRRVFDFNPAKRATIPELREMIMRCSAFTATKSVAPTPVPSPPFQPVDFNRNVAFNPCYQVPAVPSVATLPSPAYSPVPFHHTTSNGSSTSDNDSVFSSCSSASSTSSTSSYQNFRVPNHEAPVRFSQPTYVSPQPQTNTWFQPFIQAANLVKHVSFQPSMMAQPIQAY